MTSNANNSTFSVDEVVKQLDFSIPLPAELIQVFADDANELLEKIYEGLRQLNDDRSNMPALGNVRRATHTLKGAAGAVGLQALTRLAHRMEDLLDNLAASRVSISESQLELLFATADQMQQLTAGNFDPRQIAQQIVEIYQVYEDQLGRDDPAAVANDVHDNVATDGENENEDSNESVPVNPQAGASPHMRVPVQRLDELAKLMGEMTVNRSEFQHRLQAFESRIVDMQNALERLRSISHFVEEINLADVYTGRGTVGQSIVAKTPGQVRDEFDPLEFEQYSEFQLLSQKLSEADSDAEIMTGEFNKIKHAFDGLLRQQQQLNRAAQNCLMKVRMVPLSTIANRIERTVRTVSKKLGRKVSLKIVGKEIEVDKTVLDELADPILHLIRNAIDHGIEDSDVRASLKKPDTAELCLCAVNHGTQVTLTISDDGAGLDLQKIRHKAVDQDLITADTDLSDEELHALIFRPGFSTASQLSDVSGRGIGMDVVGDAISRLKGSIGVDSEPGQGTTFTIKIPTVIGVSRAVFLESAGQQFAIPMQSVEKIERFEPSTMAASGDDFVIRQTDGELRLIDLATHLGLRPNLQNGASFRKTMPMLVIGGGSESVAVTVDTILGCRDIVVKGLGNHLKNIRGLAGATIAGNGSVVPILDGGDFFNRNECMLSDQGAYRWRHQKKSLAMVIDDSISVRRFTEHLLKSSGWEVVTANDGVDALAKLTDMETEPDVFLSDLEMPRMDGLEFIRQVREQPEFQSTPIVMITGRASEKLRHKAFDAGATEFLVKPYHSDDLLELLAQLVIANQETVS